MYYTIAGGVPSADDVRKAIDDLEELYERSQPGRLGDMGEFEFMKEDISNGTANGVKVAREIVSKVVEQPYKPEHVGVGVQNFDVFPGDDEDGDDAMGTPTTTTTGGVSSAQTTPSPTVGVVRTCEKDNRSSVIELCNFP